jgi:putative endonuclease
MKQSYIYILSNKSKTTLYIGVTNNLQRRILEHKSSLIAGFTKKYNLHELMYFEEFSQIELAIAREKQLKKWHKEWKWNLIKESNPSLSDLSKDWFN